MSRALLTAAAVVLAFFVARLTAATDSERVETTPAASVRTNHVAFAPATPSPTIEQEAHAAVEPAPSQEPARNTAQQANVLVDRALARGQWKTTDRMELGAMLGQLSEVEANVVLGKLFTSINAGRITVESTPL